MSRSISADLIKTGSIIGVVFIHGSSLLGTSSDFQTYASAWFRFCVPCFIILWAYFFEKSFAAKNNTERIQYIKKRFIHLLILFFAWSLLYFLLLVDWTTLSVSKMITIHFSGYGWSGQYFFIILFQLLLLYPLLRRCYIHHILRYSILLFCIIAYVYWGYYYDIIPELLKKLGDRPFIFWLPYVFCGIALANNTFIRLPLIYICFVFLIPLEFYFLEQFALSHSAYITPGILVGSVLFCGTILQNSISITSEKVRAVITYMGNNTMIIFLANPVVIFLLQTFLFKNISSTTDISKIILPFISTLLIICICLLIDFFIIRTIDKLTGIKLS